MKFIKQILLLFIISGFVTCSAQKSKKELDNILNDLTKSIVPEIVLQKNKSFKLKDPYFTHSVGGSYIKERTVIEFSYNDEYLILNFDCLDNPYVEQNYYTEDNSAMFNQEVIELFISKGREPREEYLEIQLNPNNALFLGKTTYRYKTTMEYKMEKIDTKTSGVIHSVEKNPEENSWSGQLKIPLSLIEYTGIIPNTIYRLNIYRIILQKEQKSKNWRCNPKNSTFACWNSTMAKKMPQFHNPDYFGYLVLY